MTNHIVKVLKTLFKWEMAINGWLPIGNPDIRAINLPLETPQRQME